MHTCNHVSRPARGFTWSFSSLVHSWIQIKDQTPTSNLNLKALVWLKKTVLVHPHTHMQTQLTQSSIPLAQNLSPLSASGFFPAVAHSLMDEMRYPVLRGWIPAPVKLSLTGSNALVSVLNEALGSESFLFFYSPRPWPLFPVLWWVQGLLDVGNEFLGFNKTVHLVLWTRIL